MKQIAFLAYLLQRYISWGKPGHFLWPLARCESLLFALIDYIVFTQACLSLHIHLVLRNFRKERAAKQLEASAVSSKIRFQQYVHWVAER